MTEDRKFYYEHLEEGLFFRTMLEMFLKHTKQWKTDWITIIGEDYHFHNFELESKYDGFDGDFFSVYVKTSDNTFEEYCFLAYDFLKWYEERHSNPK